MYCVERCVEPVTRAEVEQDKDITELMKADAEAAGDDEVEKSRCMNPICWLNRRELAAGEDAAWAHDEAYWYDAVTFSCYFRIYRGFCWGGR